MTGTKIVTQKWPYLILRCKTQYASQYIYICLNDGRGKFYLSRMPRYGAGYEPLETFEFGADNAEEYDFKIMDSSAYILTKVDHYMTLIIFDIYTMTSSIVTFPTNAGYMSMDGWVSSAKIHYAFTKTGLLCTATSNRDGSDFEIVGENEIEHVARPIVYKGDNGHLQYVWLQSVTAPAESKGVYLCGGIDMVGDGQITNISREFVSPPDGAFYSITPIDTIQRSNLIYFTFLQPRYISGIAADLFIGVADMTTDPVSISLSKAVMDVGTVVVHSFVRFGGKYGNELIYAWAGGRTDVGYKGGIYRGTMNGAMSSKLITTVLPCKRPLAFDICGGQEYYIWAEQNGGLNDLYVGQYIRVTGVTLDKLVYVRVGGTKTLTATVLPENADDKSVTWESSDVNIATVEDGVVTGVDIGVCTVAVTTVDGGYTASATVVVIGDDRIGNRIYKFNSGEEEITSSFTTEVFTENYMGKKGYSDINIEADVDGEMNVYLKRDNNDFALAKTFISSKGRNTFRAMIKPCCQYTFQIKVEVIGTMKLHRLERTFFYGGGL